ncbi:HutD/Ves family protein [Caballeronia sordidicola]|uniref:HutD/Ves family protein n=1 Tax=Caballeronia sordidicola TaxID=196367 RepID=UPI000B76C3A9|nr:HutD family protein [Caballeronia sordidicola]
MASVPFPDAGLPVGVVTRPLTSFETQAWRNGGGKTRPLAEESGASWRISLANVERDGPYSRFPGMTRQSLIVKGAGVTLQHEASRVELVPGRSIEYDGDMEWWATLRDGPVVALNTMVDQSQFRAEVILLRKPLLVPSRCFALVLPLNGSCAWRTRDLATATMLDADMVMTRGHGGPDILLIPLGDLTQDERYAAGNSTALVLIEDLAEPMPLDTGIPK